jgi:hypothetical protein
VDVFCLNAASDAAKVISDQFVKPGFRVICLSQRLFGAPTLDLPIEWQSSSHSIFQYRSGDDVTIACFNFALRSGIDVANRLAAAGIRSDLFHINFLPSTDTEAIRKSCARTGKLMLIDDSKTVSKLGDRIVANLYGGDTTVSVLPLMRRDCANDGYGVGGDQFTLDQNLILEFVGESRSMR